MGQEPDILTPSLSPFQTWGTLSCGSCPFWASVSSQGVLWAGQRTEGAGWKGEPGCGWPLAMATSSQGYGLSHHCSTGVVAGARLPTVPGGSHSLFGHPWLVPRYPYAPGRASPFVPLWALAWYSGQELEPRLRYELQEKRVPARKKEHIESLIKAAANCQGRGLAARLG